MKQVCNIVFIFALTIVCSVAKAQVRSLEIVNNTGCDVWLVFHGSLGPCNTDYSSNPILIRRAPSPVVVYNDPSFVPGGMRDAFLNILGPAGFFTRVRILNSHPSSGCASGGSSVTGSGCPGPSSTSATVEDASCTPCGPVTVDWVPLTPSIARIDIN